MNITVILSTYNRSQSLTRALESASALALPRSAEWEVLVVDNNSRDQTREVVEDFRRRHPGRFRYLFEPRPGKSHALNAGIRESRSDVLAFMDDDVTVEPSWLQNLTAALHSGQWSGGGGRILPVWSHPRPDWLPVEGRYRLAPLAVFDLGLEAGPLREPPFGTNMAFRREVFERYGDFRTDLGPLPGVQTGPHPGHGLRPRGRGEDTEFGRRLLDGGESLRYEPSAIVYHPVPKDRLRKEYFLEWWFDKGRSEIREVGTPPGARHFVAGMPLYLLRSTAICALRWLVTIGSPRRFYRKTLLWTKLGELVECHRHAVSARRQSKNGRA